MMMVHISVMRCNNAGALSEVRGAIRVYITDTSFLPVQIGRLTT